MIIPVKAKVSDALNHQINQDMHQTFRKNNELPIRPVWFNEKRDLADFVGSNSMLLFLNSRLQSFFSYQSADKD